MGQGSDAAVSLATLMAAQRVDHGIPVAVSCRALGVSQAWFYKWRNGDMSRRATGEKPWRPTSPTRQSMIKGWAVLWLTRGGASDATRDTTAAAAIVVPASWSSVSSVGEGCCH